MTKHYTVLIDSVKSALQSGQALNICGASSKSFYGGPVQGHTLSVTGNSGIIEYDPAELVIVARAGTPLADINALLASKGQMLGFEPPFAGQGATLGGAVATGLAGPCRPFWGGVRDYLLGAKLINGKGEVVQFGGRVMKNVAGFDLFRPMAGAMGTLGLLLEISLRVIPLPEQQMSLKITAPAAIDSLRSFCDTDRRLPGLSAASWHQGCVRIRLSGSRLVVKRDQARLREKYDITEMDDAYWQAVSQFTHPFFELADPQGCVAAIDLAPATPPLDLPGEQLIDWGGARRYLNTTLGIEAVREQLVGTEAHASLLVGGDRSECFQPLDPGLMTLHRRLKKSFDPRGIFNPGRLYAGL